MREIADGLVAWRAAGLRYAVATVVRTFSSAPRGPGAAMAVAENGEVLGSAEVPVLAADDVAGLEQRVLEAEHQLYPRVLSEFVRR